MAEEQEAALAQAAISVFDAATQDWRRLRGTHMWANLRIVFRDAVVRGTPAELEPAARHYWSRTSDAALAELQRLYRSARRSGLGGQG